jgi:hypothetical protein
VLNRAAQPPSVSSGRRRARLVDRLVVHGDLIGFRELCERAVPAETRYLVLDLDRTVHLGRNMGELLGWELCAVQGYGLDHLVEAEPRRPLTRLFLDRSRPASMLKYLALTTRAWARPGLFYFLYGKLPARLEMARRATFRTFGPEPVSAVQQVPQLALFHQMSAVPTALLRMLARRVWDRYAGDQVIEREDLAWLRSRCPNLRIVMTSASPQPSLEVASEALGVDDAIYSAIEEHGGYFSSPYQLMSALGVAGRRRIAGPGQQRINSGRAKIEALLQRYPDLADPSVVSVGISDTGYGEDHCWAAHFTRVVDVNSPTPFPPIVTAPSGAQEIHSAAVLSRSERARRAGGDRAYRDPRRPHAVAVDRAFGEDELRQRLRSAVDAVEALAARYEERAGEIRCARALLERARDDAASRIDGLAAAFNASSGAERRVIASQLRRDGRELRRVRRRLARLERPLSEISFAMSGLLAASRAELTREPA